jgi:hypothetical protein
MKNVKITALTGILLLLSCANTHAANTINSIDGCLLKLYNDRGKETNIINLKSLDVFRYSYFSPSKARVTLIYGGTGFIEIGQLSDKSFTELKNAYEKCAR